MTYKEALEWCILFEDNVIIYSKDIKKTTLALQAMKSCKEALEKQIPKKPIKTNEDFEATSGRWIIDWECPVCGNPYADDSYCSCCGQALDWSDTE